MSYTDTPTPLLPSLSDALETLSDVDIVSDWAETYGERGYSADGDGPIVFGNWNCHHYPRTDCQNTADYCNGAEYHYPAEMASLAAAGCTLEWCDEWYVDHNNGSKAWRTQPDSYGWECSLMWPQDGAEFLTPDDDLSDWIDAAANNPRVAFPSHVWTDEQLAELGFVERECGFENGWHPGQNDDPSAIFAAIRSAEPDADVLFRLSSVRQFDCRFCVYVRPADWEDSDD